jgi:hypothetical protein
MVLVAGTDLLSSMTPYAHILCSNATTYCCSRCLQRSNNLKRCSKCQRVFYCSVPCQTADWIYHKYECTSLLVRYKNDRGIAQTFGKRSVDDLQTHENEIRQDRRRYRTFQLIFQQMQDWHVIDTSDEKMVFLLFCRLVINTLTIHDPTDLKSIAYGLYLDASVYNHSCRPTCQTLFNGLRLTVRTIVDQRDDEQWTINYIDLLTSYEDRQVLLAENYYFPCRCQRCLAHDRKEETFLLEKIRSFEDRMDRSIDNGDFQQAYAASEQLCRYYDEILPTYHAYVVLHHVKHLKLAMLLADAMNGDLLKSIMKTTRERVRVSFDKDHPLASETCRIYEQYQFEVSLQQKRSM